MNKSWKRVTGLVAALLGFSSSAAAVEYGTMVDNRDNHSYHTVILGGKTWLAENMAIDSTGSYAPNGDNKNIPIYGRLYSWTAAQHVCPLGWRLPSKDDYKAMLKAVCGKVDEVDGVIAARDCQKKLEKAGFAALPAGNYEEGKYEAFGEGALWWTSSLDAAAADTAYVFFVADDMAALSSNSYKDVGLSVRCVKN